MLAPIFTWWCWQDGSLHVPSSYPWWTSGPANFRYCHTRRQPWCFTHGKCCSTYHTVSPYWLSLFVLSLINFMLHALPLLSFTTTNVALFSWPALLNLPRSLARLILSLHVMSTISPVGYLLHISILLPKFILQIQTYCCRVLFLSLSALLSLQQSFKRGGYQYVCPSVCVS